jgi:MscS family membrane protein
MQPTPELISAVQVDVAPDQDPVAVRTLLNNLLLGHPDLLGDLDQKLERLDDFLTLSPEKRAHGRERLLAERQVDRAVSSLLSTLKEFADAVRAREKRGLSREERAELLERWQPIRRSVGWIHESADRLTSFESGQAGFLEQIQADLTPESLAQRSWSWVSTWGQDPDLLPEHDAQLLKARWGERILSLLRRVENITSNLERGGGLELRLDDDVLGVVGWIRREYKQQTPAWKASGTGFKGLVGGGFLFHMNFYVDDIELEHFERQSRVEGQVRREAYRRLRAEGIRLPARFEIAFHDVGLPTTPEKQNNA